MNKEVLFYINEIKKKDLLNHGITENISFLKWLIRNDYINTIVYDNIKTDLYDLRDIPRQLSRYNLEELLVKYQDEKNISIKIGKSVIPDIEKGFFAKVRIKNKGEKIAFLYSGYAYLDDGEKVKCHNNKVKTLEIFNEIPASLSIEYLERILKREELSHLQDYFKRVK